MRIPKNELRIETMRGTGPGGQRRNTANTAVRITHLPTGVKAYADERSQKHSRRRAMRELLCRLASLRRDAQANYRKTRRDQAIKDRTIVRTYDYKTGQARDHRTGRQAPLKQVLGKGRLDLLQ